MTAPTRSTTTRGGAAHHSASWESSAACADRLDLPWTHDRADVTAWQALAMTAICDACPVLAACTAAVAALDVTGGWWAGTDRDPFAVDPTDLVPLTWRPLLARSGRTLGAQGALDLDHLGHLAHLDGFDGMAAA